MADVTITLNDEEKDELVQLIDRELQNIETDARQGNTPGVADVIIESIKQKLGQ